MRLFLSLREPATLLLSATWLVVLGACNGQGEGELCDTRAPSVGDSDCATGLVCTPRTSVVMNPYGICCPSNIGQATAANCISATLDASPLPPVTDGAATETPEAGDASDASDASDSSDAAPE